MPHVALVPLTGFRICDPELRELGYTLPGLRRRGKALSELPALGLLTLAGQLPENWTCSYHPVDGTAADDVFEAIDRERPTLVAISALTASIEQGYRFSQRVRRLGIPVVIGGLHATALPDEAGQFCDAVVVGDGEACWPQVLTDVQQSALRPLYRASGRDSIDWPLPRFDLLGNRVPRYTVQTQRGCPLSCDFCAASRLLGRFREKPLDRIKQELESMGRVQPRPLLELADDNTFAGTRDAESLCDALAAQDARWFTESDWRIGERPELLHKMAAAGCVQVLVGVESLVFRYPGMGVKRAELDRVMAALDAIQDAGIAVNGCFIVGADGETRASIERLVDFVLHSPLADVQLTLQTPFPGTALRARLAQQNRLLADAPWSSYTLLDVTFQPDCMTPDELKQVFHAAVSEVYSVAATAKREAIRRNVWRRSAAFSKTRAV